MTKGQSHVRNTVTVPIAVL